MRKLIVVAAAVAAFSCGGTSSSLSKDEAQSVASQLYAAMQTHADSGGSKLLTFGGSKSVTASCAGGGTLTVNASLSVNCPSGYWSCTSTGSLSLAAAGCTTSDGVVINGTVTGTTSGAGISFTTKVSGTITVTRPNEGPSACAVNLTFSYGTFSGTVCGIAVSK